MLPASSSSVVKPRGVALLTVLLAVLLLTVFVSESFFDMGLEIRALRTHQDAQKARYAARSGLRLITKVMQLDEVLFFTELAKLQALAGKKQLRFGNVIVQSISVRPLDHLYNLNELNSLQPNSDRDRIRWELFWATMQEIPLPAIQLGAPPENVSEYIAAQIYAATVDWTDSDDTEYNGASGASGAESESYSFGILPVAVKNSMLDDFNEIRLLRGVLESKIPWGTWNNYFTVLPRFGNQSWFLPERINVNTASRQEIVSHLKRRQFTSTLSSNNNRITRDGIQPYADRAEEIAAVLLPEDEIRPLYGTQSLSKALEELGFNDNFGTNYLLSTINTYYWVSIITDASGIESQIEALVNIPRDKNSRASLSSRVVSVWLR